MVSFLKAGIQIQCLPQFPFRNDPIPIKVEGNRRQCPVRFRRCRVKFNRFPRRMFRQKERFFGGDVPWRAKWV
jgi:hypothetical protein